MSQENPNNITDTFFGKLKEQSFTIILLVGILWYQNNIYQSNLEEYKKMIEKKDDLILKLTDEERNRLIEKYDYLLKQRDIYVDELIVEHNK